MTELVTIGAGIVGWVIAHFFFEPYAQIRDLRYQTQEALIIFGNISVDSPENERAAAYAEFRRIGAGLVARQAAAPRRVGLLARRALRLGWKGWDLLRAGEGLIALGSSIATEGISMATLQSRIKEIRDHLDLPTPEPSPSMQRALRDEGDDTFPAPRAEPRP